MKANQLIKEIKSLENKEYAKHNLRFFKTAIGEYGEGDQFLGLRMPQIRELADQYVSLDLLEVQRLLDSPIHEIRMCGGIILTYKYKKAKDLKLKTAIFKLYTKNWNSFNNWDLVDVTCHKVVGAYCFETDPKLMLKWSKSKQLWQKRIAMVSCYYFIKKDDSELTIAIANNLVSDEHDLIHKAVGWMLRELAKKNPKATYSFLDQHSHYMPRTMLRYALERLPKTKKTYYMNAKKKFESSNLFTR
ncbi:MAG: DNA alkylation repair protein [Bdellovibrionales bacterium]